MYLPEENPPDYEGFDRDWRRQPQFAWYNYFSIGFMYENGSTKSLMILEEESDNDDRTAIERKDSGK